MKDLEIKYNQSKLNLTIVMGLVFLGLFAASLIWGSRPTYIGLVFGILNTATYFYRRTYNYLTLKDGILKKDFGASIPLCEIIDTKRFAGDYTFRSKDKKIVIDKSKVDKNSVDDIENLINELRAANADQLLAS